jgi:fructose-bisphosphate aldolase, class II
VTLATAADLITDAAARGRAVPAFNVITLEQVEAVAGGAEDAAVAVLLQVSENAIRFHGGFGPLLAACREVASAASVPIGIHVDHLEDAGLAHAVLDRAEELGVGSLMFDAATLPYAENAALTASVVRAGHDRGVWVEGELGEIGGKDGAHAPGVRTDPDEAIRFVADTGVDGLAVAVGSVHAMTDRSASLDLDLIARLAASVPVPLVLHGSSGVSDALLSDAVAAGIRKVNIGTALGIAGTARLRSELTARPDAVDPRSYLRGVRTATREVVAHLASVVG